MKRAVIILIGVSMLSAQGCAHRARIANPDAIYVQGMLLDAKGKDREKLAQDGNECAAIAQETAPTDRAVAGAIVGAAAGALLGALVFRGSGLSGNRGATFGAGVGGLSGAGEGAAAGHQDYKTVLRNCMIGRGHMPLN